MPDTTDFSLYNFGVHLGTSLGIWKAMLKNVIHPLTDVIVIVTYFPSDLEELVILCL